MDFKVGSAAWRRTIWLPGCLSGLDARVLFSNDTAALNDAAQLWNRLYSNSTPIAVVYPNTPAAVAAAVVCARKAGVKIVAKCVWWLALAHAHCSHSCGPLEAADTASFATPAPSTGACRYCLQVRGALFHGILNEDRNSGSRSCAARHCDGGSGWPHCHCSGGEAPAPGG